MKPGEIQGFEPPADIKITNVALGSVLADATGRTTVQFSYVPIVGSSDSDDDEEEEEKEDDDEEATEPANDGRSSPQITTSPFQNAENPNWQ